METGALAKTLELVGQMVAQPRIDDEDFQRERQLQLSELASGPDDVSWIAGSVFPTLLYGSRPSLGLPRPGL